MSQPPIPKPLHPLIVRRPAVALAVCYTVGILLSPHAAVRPTLWITLATLSLAISVVSDYAAGRFGFSGRVTRPLLSKGAPSAGGWHPLVAGLLLAVAIVLTGALTGQLDRFGYAPAHIVAFTTDAPRLARVRLHLDDPPRLVHARRGNPRQVTRATVTDVLTTSGWRPATGQVVLQITNSNTPFTAGQTVETLAWLSRPEPAANPGQFDWAAYYRDQRIVARLDVPEPGCARVLSDGAAGVLWPVRQRVRGLLARGFTEDQSVDHALLRALLLGDNDPQLRDIQDVFVATGTSHHLAISGMHVSVLGGIVYLVCRVGRMRPRRSAVVVMAFVLFYGAVALPSPPVLRSVILCALVLGGGAFRRSVDVVQLLALSVFAMLVADPLDLFAAGFQLSFLTVLGLIVLTPWLDRKITERLYDEHDRVAGSLARPGLARRAWTYVGRHLRGALVAAVVAWVVSLPLILAHFDRLNPWAIVGSIVLAPVVFLGLVGGLLKVLLTLAVPLLAGTWATLAAAPITWMRHTVEWLAVLPGSDVPFPAPPAGMILLFYALLCLPLIPWRARVATLLARAAPAGGLALVLAPWPLAVLRSTAAPPPPCLRLTVLSVGAGSCAVLETPDGHVAVIDAGSSSVQPLERNILRPFFRTRRIARLDALFVTHANADHYNAVDDVLAECDTHEVIVAHAFAADTSRSESAAQFVSSLRTAHRGPRTVAAGDRLTLGRQVSIDVLWPPAGARLDANDGSLVLRLAYAGRSILVTGDIGSAAQRALVNTGPEDMQADVLLAPQHGGSVDVTPFFINEANPSIIISSNDRTRTAKQLQFETDIAPRPLHRTDRCGAVTVTIDSTGGITTETFYKAPRGR